MKPTFIGIGGPRCGTTSVYYYLRQHPQVFVSSPKETHHFSYLSASDDVDSGRAVLPDPIKSHEQYMRLFDRTGTAIVAGEISPSYLWWPGVAETMAAMLPEARLFCILRNPIDRAYSSYLGYCSAGQEKRSFDEAVRTELDSGSPYPLLANHYYIRTGMYSRHLEGYLRHFEGRLAIHFYDDLEASSAQFMRHLFRFLGVDPEFPVDTFSRFNTSGTMALEGRYRVSPLKRLSGGLRAILPLPLYLRLYRRYSALAAKAPRPAMAEATRHRLREVYAPEIQRLEALVSRDLSHWLAAR